MLKPNIKDTTEINNIVAKALNNLIYIVCGRCGTGKDGFHHIGIFNKFIQSKKNLCGENFQWFIEDIEHGLFHGISTAVVLQIISDCPVLKESEDFFLKEHYQLIKQMISALFHDYLKREKSHDTKLKEYFDFTEETYTHANPKKITNLIKADRLELQRYNDFSLWKDKKKFAFYNNLNQRFVDQYYKNIRPALELLYQYRNLSWIGHGLEAPCYDLVKDEYPLLVTDEFGEFFCIENGRPPFYCNPHSSSHKVIYGSIRCWTPVSMYNKFGEITTTNTITTNRDHLLIKGSSPSKDWVAIYREGYIEERNKISKSGLIGPISEENVRLFLKAAQLIEDRFYCLNIDRFE